MFRNLVINLIIILIFSISSANAGITKFGLGFGRSFEDYQNFEYKDNQNIENNFKTINFNATYFFNNGINFSISTNRLINHKSKREAMQSGVQFKYEYESFIDTFMIGYKINRLNSSLVLANVNLKSRSYNDSFDVIKKNSAIVPAINFSYNLASYKNINIVPSISFYRSKELEITKGALVNINFIF